MTTRLKDSERTRLIAYYIRTGKNPEGYEITENESSKYKVHKIKSQLEVLQTKRDRLKRQLESIEAELTTLITASQKQDPPAQQSNAQESGLEEPSQIDDSIFEQ